MKSNLPANGSPEPPPPPRLATGQEGQARCAMSPPDAGPGLKLLYEGKDEQFLDEAIRETLAKCRSGKITR